MAQSHNKSKPTRRLPAFTLLAKKLMSKSMQPQQGVYLEYMTELAGGIHPLLYNSYLRLGLGAPISKRDRDERAMCSRPTSFPCPRSKMHTDHRPNQDKVALHTADQIHGRWIASSGPIFDQWF